MAIAKAHPLPEGYRFDIGGVIASTLPTLIVVPVLLVYVDGLTRRFSRAALDAPAAINPQAIAHAKS